jgi:hypothetical protein
MGDMEARMADAEREKHDEVRDVREKELREELQDAWDSMGADEQMEWITDEARDLARIAWIESYIEAELG